MFVEFELFAREIMELYIRFESLVPGFSQFPGNFGSLPGIYLNRLLAHKPAIETSFDTPLQP